MDWHSITGRLSSAYKAVKHTAEKAVDGVENEAGKIVHGVEHAGARLGAKVAAFEPFETIAPPLADKLELFFQEHSGLSFPHELNVPKPNTHVALAPGARASIVPPEGFQLSSKQPTASFGVHMDAAGDARLDLKAAGPGTDWGKKGAESAVMSVYVDGKYKQDVVLYGGAKDTPYALALGKLPAGDHTVTLRYAKEKSTPGAQGVNVSAGTATAVKYPNQEAQWAAENAPILIGRHGGLENNHTDTPMGMYHNVDKNPDGTTTISYGYFFSNEDAGDGAQPAVEQARWGRLTDLETVYTVTLDPQGKVLDRQYEGAGHNWHSFGGKYDGSHPIIRTATDNNNTSDKGDGPLRFEFPTDYNVGDFPTEDFMRRNPVMFAVEGKELQREGKIDPTGVGSKPDPSSHGKLNGILGEMGLHKKATMADPRNYLYVQLTAQGAAEDPVTAHVTLKNGQTFDSDLGNHAVAVARGGWAQTTVKLPPGTKPEDVAKVSFSSGNGTAKVARLGHMFMLDESYEPQNLPASLAGF